MNDAELISAVVVAIVAYVFITVIRPAQRDQKMHRQQIRDLRPGDRVLTTANIVARIKDIQIISEGQTRILLEIADGVVVTAMPGAILKRMEPDTVTETSKREEPA